GACLVCLSGRAVGFLQSLADRPEEVHRGGFRLLARLPLRGGDVEGYAEADIAASGVSRRRPALAISADEAPEVGDRDGPWGDEQGKAHAPDERVGLLRRRRDAERRMRLLEGLRRHAHVVEVKVLPRVGETLLRPGLDEDLQGLEKAFAALGVGDVEPRVVPRQAAPADAELEAPLRQMVHRRYVLGET